MEHRWGVSQEEGSTDMAWTLTALLRPGAASSRKKGLERPLLLRELPQVPPAPARPHHVSSCRRPHHHRCPQVLPLVLALKRPPLASRAPPPHAPVAPPLLLCCRPDVAARRGLAHGPASADLSRWRDRSGRPQTQCRSPSQKPAPRAPPLLPLRLRQYAPAPG